MNLPITCVHLVAVLYTVESNTRIK